MSASAPVLVVEDLTVRHGGEKHALAGVSLSLRAGEVLCVVGASGAGKSTLALALLGALPPSAVCSGRICMGSRAFDADDRQSLEGLRGRGIGMVWQDPLATLHPLRTIRAQLGEVLLATRSPLAMKARLDTALLDVGLDPPAVFLRRYPHQLSGGQRQRTGVALALAAAPAVLVADEATSALDASLRLEVATLLRDRCRAAGAGLIFIAHDLSLVASMADRVLVLEQGRVVEVGHASEVLGAPCSEAARRLLAARPRTSSSRSHAAVALRENDAVREPVATTTAVRVRNLVARPGGRRMRAALDGVDFDLYRARVLGVVGASGSGKSTLARVLAGLIAPESGAVGHADKAGQSAVQLVFQDPAASFDPRMRLRESLAEPARLARRDTSVPQDLLQRVQLDVALLDRYPHELSGGQLQRFAIARALQCAPQVLVCDEAVSALDTIVQGEILNLLREIAERERVAVVFIGHDLAAVASISDYLLVLHEGRVVDRGTVAVVLERPLHPATQAMVASTRTLENAMDVLIRE